MDFNTKIQEKGLKKMWIADKLGISNVMLSYYLNDTRPMPEDIKYKLEGLLS